MAPSEILHATAKSFIERLSTLNVAHMLDLRTPDCTQIILPASLGRHPMTNEEYASTYGAYLNKAHFRNYNATIHDTLVDCAANKAVIHVTGKAECIISDFEVEYVFILQTTDDGTKIRRVREFIDSAASQAQVAKIRAAMEGT